MNTKAIAMAAMAMAVASPLAGPQDEKALKLLLNALEAQRDVKATLIQRRSVGRQTVTVKVQVVPGRGRCGIGLHARAAIAREAPLLLQNPLPPHEIPHCLTASLE